MSQDAYKMKVEYTPLLRQYSGEELWAVLEKVGYEPNGQMGDSAIFTVQTEELEEHLAVQELTAREREIVGALKVEVQLNGEAMDISFG